ncbi:thioredoxin family protein [Luteolibacter ambystomatis]|uniref:Thioredoxin family protein n=1 Tax=Luteolibacter ambystomatis TaxID=2824561 RepID=A0A975IYM6_9BACT|nr:thioredoxin family protein [Luteolibacter ambystomatis]QUE50551.1 thioredoxin family protein [Luteolibacter ambystomatis]
MKKAALFIATLFATASLSFAGSGAGWTDNYEAAKAQAKKENKTILLDFTGSDWCGWCIKLDKEVFSQKAFKDYAKDKLILVEVDFPHDKRQSRKLKEQNQALAKEFGVKGYPTVILVDGDGKKVGQTGYKEGGDASYVTHLKGLLGSKG